MNDERQPLKQDMPADMVERLLKTIRGQFCGDMPNKKWFSLRSWFYRFVLLWPARFMVGKGFIIPPKRYEEIMLAIFMDVKRHGATDAVRHWNGYLLKCVQDHWHHNWETYYQEAKSARRVAEAALLACKTVPREDRTIEHLAAAQAVLASATRSKGKTGKQLNLFKP